MYFWNITRLKRHLIDNGLTETQVFWYVLIEIALNASNTAMGGYLPATEPDVWTYANSAFCVLIPILGVFAAFRANGGAAGSQFVARYFSVSLVVAIRFIVLLLVGMALFIGYWIYTYGLADDAPDPDPSPYIIYISVWIWEIALYANIVRHIGAVAKA
ncbi:MAG: hypothetical protein PHU14_02675 [Methylovulum sp.]|nr:hypothetical protein [Methylovulum sp.]